MKRISKRGFLNAMESNTLPSKIYYGNGALDIAKYGENIIVDSVTETDDLFLTKSHSVSMKAVCPCCGHISNHHHARVERNVWDTSLRGKRTLLQITLFRYQCNNIECPIKTFREELPFLCGGYGRTVQVEAELIATAIMGSYRGTASSMSVRGMPVCHSTVSRHIAAINIIQESKPEAIGVDEVRNGSGFYTVIYSADTHQLLALLDGRDGSALEEWYKVHPHVKIVMRDRASGYSSATYRALPWAIQIADFFHLMKNINDYIKEILYAFIEKQTFYTMTSEDDKGNSAVQILTEKPAMVYTLRDPRLADVSDLDNLEYDCTPPLNPDGSIEDFDFNLSTPRPGSEAQAAKKRLKLQELARKIRHYSDELKSKGAKYSFVSIARHFNTTTYYVKQCLNMSEEEVERITEPTKRKKDVPASPYIYMIYKMLKDGHDSLTIFRYIMYKTDYSGTPHALSNQINRIIKNNFPYITRLLVDRYFDAKLPDNVHQFSRLELFYYIVTVNPKTKKDENIAAVIGDLIKQHPIIDKLMASVQTFNDIMRGEKPDELDKWIESNKNLLPPFCEGLLRDIEAVKNAISTGYNSGYVEGSNTAFKLVKRTGCGRYTIGHLCIKFALFLSRKLGVVDYYKIAKTRTFVA